MKIAPYMQGIWIALMMFSARIVGYREVQGRISPFLSWVCIVALAFLLILGYHAITMWWGRPE